MNEYFRMFEDIDVALSRLGFKARLPFKIIGRAALELAGLPERGTKDVDALEEVLKIDALSSGEVDNVESFLKKEFGKNSPGDRRHGLYLDLVGKGVAWLPRHPEFLEVKTYGAISVTRLHPVDVCVSKTFSNFKGHNDRASDRADIVESIEGGLFTAEQYVNRMDDSLFHYETHAGATEIFPRILVFLKDHIIPNYCAADTQIKYEIPSWMENA